MCKNEEFLGTWVILLICQSFSEGFYIFISRVTSEREETPRMTVSAPTGKALGGRWGCYWEDVGVTRAWRGRVVAVKV